VDDFDDDEEEYGVFLQKVNSKFTPGEDAEEPVFIVNEKDSASFVPKDIVLKLPTPLAVDGSARRSNQSRFQFDFSAVDLAQACGFQPVFAGKPFGFLVAFVVPNWHIISHIFKTQNFENKFCGP